MTINGAIVREQGVTFAIVLVKQHAMQTDYEANKTREAFQDLFPGMPLILASQDLHGEFQYQGRPDIVRFLASIEADRIPWMRYRVTERPISRWQPPVPAPHLVESDIPEEAADQPKQSSVAQSNQEPRRAPGGT